MKRELQVGDRVAVYSGVCRFIRTVAAVRDGCYVDLVVPIANTPEHSMGTVHVKQCRRLIRRERREWVLKYGPMGWFVMGPHVPVADPEGEQVEVIEARPRKAGR